MTRYLYGDSVAFPLQYDFLASLDTFVTHAAHAVHLAIDLKHLGAGIAEAAVARQRGLDALDGFHHQTLRTLHTLAATVPTPQAAEYMQWLRESANRWVEDAKRAHQATTERDEHNLQSEIARRRGEIRQSVETFLTASRLPTVESRVVLRLEAGHNDLSATFKNPQEIVTSFKLTAAAPWTSPRKVGDFAQGVDLQVGVKRSWIDRKSVV